MLPLPLLTLNLSSTSYLDTVLYDAASHCLTTNKSNAKALFSIETRANTTTLYRADHKGLNLKYDAVADIQWPTNASSNSKSLSAARVTILNGQPQSAGSFLKKTVLGGHACTSHRAVATFEPSSSFAAGTWGRSKQATSIPSRLSIYTSSVSQHQEHITEEYQGVDVLLIIYLIVSSILLTTPPDAWMNTFQSALSPITATALSPVTRSTSMMGSKRSNSSKGYTKPKIDLLETGPTELYSYPASSKSSPHVHIVRSLFHNNNTNNSHIIKAYGSPVSSSSTSSSHHSPTSSLPASPITPNVELSPITNETFATQQHYSVYSHYHGGPPPTPIVTTTRSSSRCSSLNGFGGRRQQASTTCSSQGHSPYIGTRELHSQPGPNAITPYHLPPAPTHAPPTIP
ncbi:12387_t:CDS:2, partial [Acaulospora colombiana]